MFKNIITTSLSLFLCLIFLIPIGHIHLSSLSAAEGAKAREEKVTINFVDVALPIVVDFISKITGKNFIYDESLPGKVTIIVPSKITVDEAFDLFTSVLELKGYSLAFTGTAYKIVPYGSIKQNSLTVLPDLLRGRTNESYIIRLIPLVYVKGQDVIPMLQPLISKGGYITAFIKGGNALLLVDSALNIEKILNIVKLLDVKPRGHPREIVYLKNAQAENIAHILRQMKAWDTKSMPKPPGVPQESLGLIADKRLNALLLFGSSEENAEYKRLIGILDVSPPAASSRINIYYLENADATEIAAALDGLIRQQPLTPGAPQAGAPQADSELSGRVTITTDKSTNSLIIVASPDDYQNNIIPVIHKLDRKPRQVFVEALLIEVSLDKLLAFGISWRAAATKGDNSLGIGGMDKPVIDDIINGLVDSFTLGGLSGQQTIVPTTQFTAHGFAVLLASKEFRNFTNILSTPHILTSNNREAEIMVGENVPLISKLEVAAATPGQPLLQSLERRDVGILLRIKPQISEGDYIKLDIYQEISAVQPRTSEIATNAQDIILTKRAAKTSVVVKDKQTVIIGGLIQDKETKSKSQVPLLGDIPILGWLFKSKRVLKEKTNLLVYLTPTIVKGFNDLDEIAQKKNIEFDKNSIINGDKEKKQKEKKKDDF